MSAWSQQWPNTLSKNTGPEDLVYLELFKTSVFQDLSLNDCIARLPPEMAQAHPKLPAEAIARIPQQNYVVLPK